MSVLQQNLDKLTITAGVATAAVTSTATSSAIDLLEFDGDVLLILDSAAGGGSSPTLDVKLTESDASVVLTQTSQELLLHKLLVLLQCKHL